MPPHPYHKGTQWRARVRGAPILVTIHSYYNNAWGWNVTYQFHPLGPFYSLPAHEFSMIFEELKCETPLEGNSSSKTGWRSRLRSFTNALKFSGGKREPT